MEITADDILDAARTVWAESRSEPFDGQVAVAHVILTRARRAVVYKGRIGRVHPLYGEGDLSGAVRKPWQFSPWLESDPQYSSMLELTLESVTDRAFRSALLAVLGAVEGKFGDPTGGSTHFFAAYIDPPDWADPDKLVCRIGNHAFYDLGDG